jgi:hypothetical protein
MSVRIRGGGVTAICCPADVPCLDHRATRADLMAENARLARDLAAAQASLRYARIMVNAIALVSDHPMPTTVSDSGLYKTVDQLHDRLCDIHYAADKFGRGDRDHLAKLLHQWAGRSPFTYEVNQSWAEYEAQLAEATQ